EAHCRARIRSAADTVAARDAVLRAAARGAWRAVRQREGRAARGAGRARRAVPPGSSAARAIRGVAGRRRARRPRAVVPVPRLHGQPDDRAGTAGVGAQRRARVAARAGLRHPARHLGRAARRPAGGSRADVHRRPRACGAEVRRRAAVDPAVRGYAALAARRRLGGSIEPRAAGDRARAAEHRVLRAPDARVDAGDAVGRIPACSACARVFRSTPAVRACAAAGDAAGRRMAVAGADQRRHRLGRGRAGVRHPRHGALLRAGRTQPRLHARARRGAGRRRADRGDQHAGRCTACAHGSAAAV
ncbi:MAG: Oligopeptide transport system permease protein OppB, partial [uncultured Lysobacter sp.]